MGRNIQTGARSATEQFNRFIEGPDGRGHGSGPGSRTSGSRYEPERKDFWDDFSSLGDNRRTSMMGGGAPGGGRSSGGSGAGAIGTATMKREPSTKAKTKAKDDDWDDNW